MDSIYLERQEGQLCAQHCLNNLLQGPFFTAVELADFAHQLDEAEKARMAEGDITSPEFLRFMQQPSTNMDDSGYFSVQVISNALRVWNLDLVPLSSPTMKHAMENPITQQAFICNHDYHWLTVRKLGQQWFNLDSLLKKPKLISDTYLSLFLTQLQMEGYAIFVVIGSLPTSEADELLTLVPVKPEKSPPLSPSKQQASSGRQRSKKRGEHSREESSEEFVLQLATAMSASLKPEEMQAPSGSHRSKKRGEHSREESSEEFVLQLATAMSASLKPEEMQAPSGSHRSKKRGEHSREESSEEFALRLATAMSASLKPEEMQQQQQYGEFGTGLLDKDQCAVEEEEFELAVAISASLDDQRQQQSTSGGIIPHSEEELRQRRLLHLGQIPPPQD